MVIHFRGKKRGSTTCFQFTPLRHYRGRVRLVTWSQDGDPLHIKSNIFYYAIDVLESSSHVNVGLLFMYVHRKKKWNRVQFFPLKNQFIFGSAFSSRPGESISWTEVVFQHYMTVKISRGFLWTQPIRHDINKRRVMSTRSGGRALNSFHFRQQMGLVEQSQYTQRPSRVEIDWVQRNGSGQSSADNWWEGLAKCSFGQNECWCVFARTCRRDRTQSGCQVNQGQVKCIFNHRTCGR